MNCVIKQWLVRYLFQNYQLIKPVCSDFLKGLFCSHNKNTVCDDVAKEGILLFSLAQFILVVTPPYPPPLPLTYFAENNG